MFLLSSTCLVSFPHQLSFLLCVTMLWCWCINIWFLTDYTQSLTWHVVSSVPMLFPVFICIFPLLTFCPLVIFLCIFFCSYLLDLGSWWVNTEPQDHTSLYFFLSLKFTFLIIITEISPGIGLMIIFIGQPLDFNLFFTWLTTEQLMISNITGRRATYQLSMSVEVTGRKTLLWQEVYKAQIWPSSSDVQAGSWTIIFRHVPSLIFQVYFKAFCCLIIILPPNFSGH